VNSTRHPVRVVVIGCGLIGRKRLEAIELLDDATLTATVDPVRGPAADMRAPHYGNLRELTPEAYDAAIIAVPHDAAPALTEAILAAGKPVLVEKPLATSSAAARKLEELADKVPSPSFVGYNYRFLPTVRELMKIAADGRLGRLRSIDMLIGHGGHPESGKGWKLDPTRAGGGVLLDPGVHLLDLLLQIAPAASCTGAEATRGFWGGGIEEDVAVTFRAGMLLVTLRVSHIRWINTFRFEMFGEDAYCIAEGRGGNYGPMILRFGKRWGWANGRGDTQRGSETVWHFGTTDMSLRDELAEVTHLWRTGRVADHNSHPATFAEARAVIELLDELYARMQ
jgi:1,5-anhydro-D-fructose reductase (1,5-anhydro-D-mannitol-forming)